MNAYTHCCNAPTSSSDKGLHELREAIERWQLVEDGPPLHMGTSVLQRVRTHDEPAFLKVAFCEEECRGAALLHWWNGEGAVRVLARHGNTALLECACGSRSLARMSRTGQDAEASRILCAVAARLHRQAGTPPPELIPLTQWFTALAVMGSARGGIFRESAAIAHALLAAPQHVVVLHGDVHHGNILDAGPRGWLAIDPKGLLGERGFDFANIFCNPDHQTATPPECFERRVTIVSTAANMERTRLLQWVAAWAGLSAAWHLEDGGNPETALAVAALALGSLRR